MEIAVAVGQTQSLHQILCCKVEGVVGDNDQCLMDASQRRCLLQPLIQSLLFGNNSIHHCELHPASRPGAGVGLGECGGKTTGSVAIIKGPTSRVGMVAQCLRPWAGDVAGAEVGDMIGTVGDGELGAQNGGLVPVRGSWTDLQDANRQSCFRGSSSRGRGSGAAQCVWVQNKGSGGVVM